MCGDTPRYAEKMATHLAHFGIDVMAQSKYDKLAEELELDRNKNFVFIIIVGERQEPAARGGRRTREPAQPGQLVLHELGAAGAAGHARGDKTEVEQKDSPSWQKMAKLVAGLNTDSYLKQKAPRALLGAAKARKVYGGDDEAVGGTRTFWTWRATRRSRRSGCSAEPKLALQTGLLATHPVAVALRPHDERTPLCLVKALQAGTSCALHSDAVRTGAAHPLLAGLLMIGHVLRGDLEDREVVQVYV